MDSEDTSSHKQDQSSVEDSVHVSDKLTFTTGTFDNVSLSSNVEQCFTDIKVDGIEGNYLTTKSNGRFGTNLQTLNVGGESLKCGFCQDYFNDPKLLPCMHSFCKSCLEPLCVETKKECSPVDDGNTTTQDSYKENEINVVEDRQVNLTMGNGSEKLKKRVKCPQCEEAFDLPETGVEGLISNTALIKLIKSQQKLSQTKDCDICKLRQTSETAVSFCTDCKDLLCQSCWKSHSFTRFTLNHKVIALDELGESDLTSVIVDSIVQCSDHPDEQVKYFCMDCNCIICRECILLIHKNHNVVLSSVVAGNKRQELQALVYGFNERLGSLKEDENSEFQTQTSRLDQAECIEAERIDKFFNDVIQAIEKRRQEVLCKTKTEFSRMRIQSKNRFSCYENIEQQMKGVNSALDLLTSQSSDVEFLIIEPSIHRRVVQMINAPIKPYPTSWYNTPSTHLKYPLVVSFKNQNIEVSDIKVDGPKQKFEPTESIPIEHSLKELIELGKFKGIVHHEVGPTDKPVVIKTEQRRADFVDATVWGQQKAVEIYEDNDDDLSDSSWMDESCNDQKTLTNKTRRRGKRGGKKNKAKKETAASNGSSQNNPMGSFNPGLGMKAEGFGNNQNDFPRNFGNLYSTTAVPTSTYPYGIPTRYTGSFQNLSFQGAIQHNMQASKQGTPVQNSNAPKQPQSVSSSKPVKPPTGAENETNPTPQKVISLKPKWRLDVKLSSDKFEPDLKGVYCFQKTSIIVSDSNNSKIKIFTADGQFIKSLDLKNVGRSVFTADMLIYSGNQKVYGRKEDGKDLNAMSFDNTSNECLVAWSPKRHVLVACGNKLREYNIDREKDCFVRTRNIAIGSGSVKEICDVRCDQNGRRLVIVDSATKSVVIFDFEGTVIGMFIFRLFQF